MGWEQIPPECALPVLTLVLGMLLLGMIAGWRLAHIWAKSEWEIRQEVLLEEKRERKERKRERMNRKIAQQRGESS